MDRKRIQIAGRAGVLAICFAALALFGGTGLHPFLENRIFDTFFQLRDALLPVPARTSPVTIVGIDAKTLAGYRDPVIFWDREFAETIRIVASARPRVIGFDVLHLARGGASVYKARSDRLKDAILKTNNIVLPYSSETGDIPVYIARHFEKALGLSGDLPPKDKINILTIAEKTTGVGFGFVELSEDADGIIREPVLVRGNSRVLTGFPLKIFMQYHGIGTDEVAMKGDTLHAGNRTIPLADGAFIINFAGPPGSFIPVSMIDVSRRKNDRDFLARHFRDRAVLIGVWDSMLMDIHSTPYVSSGGGRGRIMYGVEVMAGALDTMLRGRYIARSGAFDGLALCLVFILGGIALARIGTIRGVAIMAAVEAAYLALAFALFAFRNYQIAASLPMLGLPAGFGAGYLFEHYILGRDRLLLERVLGSYLDPRVVKDVVSTGDTGILKGQRREITVLFSDIRNFTTLSEKMKRPEDVVEILNIYLPEMSSIIFAADGCVDKFIGDGIMAFWNAPNDVRDHAARAVRCALDMQARMKAVNGKLRQKGLVPDGLHIGIGIHTGTAVVGNIGGEAKNDYTAIGDTVNLASRLEGKTKDYGCNIIISEAVHERIASLELPVRPIGRIEVKGKKRKVKVYGITG